MRPGAGLILLAALIAGCAETPTRVRFEDPAGMVSVAFASAPEQVSEPADEFNLAGTGYEARVGDADYDFWQFRHGMPDAASALDLYRTTVMQSYEGFSLISDTALSFGDYPGMAMVFEHDFAGWRLKEELRYYVIGENTYILGYSAPADAYSAGDAAAFMASLGIEPRQAQE